MTLRFVRSFEVPGEFLEPHPATLHSVLCHPLIYCAIEIQRSCWANAERMQVIASLSYSCNMCQCPCQVFLRLMSC